MIYKEAVGEIFSECTCPQISINARIQREAVMGEKLLRRSKVNNIKEDLKEILGYQVLDRTTCEEGKEPSQLP
jgi:hypothetical protein